MTEAPVSLAVVVPTCNARHLLARSLASVAAQSASPSAITQSLFLIPAPFG